MAVTTDTEARIQAIFREVFEDENLEIHREMTAAEVENWDSITHTELISAVEDAFGIKFKLREISKWRNVGDFIDAVEAKLN
jgi:acyl carrier protein